MSNNTSGSILDHITHYTTTAALTQPISEGITSQVIVIIVVIILVVIVALTLICICCRRCQHRQEEAELMKKTVTESILNNRASVLTNQGIN
jgi:heme/copper-type cytochrome/quinol oxidase subunit 2